MKDLDYWLDEVRVEYAYKDRPYFSGSGWYSVETGDEAIAFFKNKVDAERFRLDYINRKLNP